MNMVCSVADLIPAACGICGAQHGNNKHAEFKRGKNQRNPESVWRQKISHSKKRSRGKDLQAP
jgi:hypothetical protein